MFDNLFYSSIPSIKQNNISFEDMQNVIKNGELIINTLPINEQECLIKNTTLHIQEEKIMNDLIAKYEYGKKIILYGKNCNDETVDKKWRQLRSLGFLEVYCYRGGLFEWLLLGETYTTNEFPIINKSHSRVIDIYKYRPQKRFINE